MDEDRIEKLLHDLLRPMFIWTMANASVKSYQARHEDTPQMRGARTRRRKALEEINSLLVQYQNDQPESNFISPAD